MNGNSDVVKKENKYLMNDAVFEMQRNLEFVKKTANLILEENKDYKNGIERWNSSNSWIEQRIKKNISNLNNIISEANWHLKRSNIQNYDSSYTKILNSKFKNMTMDEAINKAMNCKDDGPKIELYKESQMMSEMMLIPIFFTSVNFGIAQSTIKYSIELDLNMPIHLNLKDTIDLSLNFREPTMLVDFIPDMRKITKEKMLSVINQVSSFQTKKNVFDTVIKLSEEKNYVCSNILIMPLIESLTKDFLKAVYESQNPNLNEEQIEKLIYCEYNSLNELISKIKLTSDYPINYGELQGEYFGSTNQLIVKENNIYHKNLKLQQNSRGYLQKVSNICKDESLTDEEKINKIETLTEKILNHGIKEKDLIKDIKKPIFIPINIRLEFLQRKMYQDRNQILHGQFDTIEPWKHYLYLNGLYKLFEVVEDYYKKRKPN